MRSAADKAAGIDYAGHPFIWMLEAAPVLIVFVVLNSAWTVSILSRRRWGEGLLLLLAAFTWFVANAIDSARQ
jgi:hypothetical protein